MDYNVYNNLEMKGLNLSGRYAAVFVFAVSLLVLFAPILFIEYQVLKYTNGIFIYPFDDTFIHLDLANNIVSHGTWGINPPAFASASSSLLYTVILTIGRFLSSGTLMPFVINCLAGILIVYTLCVWLRKQGINAWAIALTTALAVLITPLPTLIIAGMEHTIQCLVCFLFIFHFSDWLEKYAQTKKEQLPWPVVVYAILTATIRYEGLFLIAIAGVLLLYYRNLKAGIVLVFFALLPVIIFGLYSLSKGSYFLPNSLLVKSESLNASGPAAVINQILFEKLTFARSGMAALATQRWLIILPLAYLAFRKQMKLSYSFILVFLFAGTLLHLSLAATGTLYRYEAYLFFSSVVITVLLLFKYGKELWAAQRWPIRFLLAVLLFFLCFPIALRGVTAIARTGQASINIFDQQYQMAQFSKKYYDNSAIAANDIGALAYFTHATIVDLWGLATIDVTRSKKNGYWTPQFLDSLSRARGAKVAMIYDSWFSDSLTSRWNKVATWQIQNNIICGDDTVSFYSIDSAGKAGLQRNLKVYQPLLPPTVRVRYY